MTIPILSPGLDATGYIRWSSDKQSDSTSLPRQRRMIRECAADMGWTVSREIRDEAVSAFFGHNLGDGQLGNFIRQCEREGGDGRALIVEMISRVSRLNAFDALMNLGRMVETGLTVVLADQRMVINSATIRHQRTQLESIIAQMEKAHREIDDKTRVIRQAWEIMREEGRPVHCRSTCPAWLEMDAKRTRFLNRDELSPLAHHRAAVVNEIFDLYIKGKGLSWIVRHLNERGEPTFRNGKGWGKSSVKALIQSRSVIGEYQHHVQRQPVGNPIADYFPSIISNEKFMLANEAGHRRVMSSHAEKKLINLLTNVAKCAECGSRMTFHNKSRVVDRVNSTYLQCDGYARGKGCKSRKMVRYPALEAAVLDAFLDRALDDSHFIASDDVAEVRRRMADAQRTLDDANTRLTNVTDTLMNCTNATLKRQLDIRATTAAVDVDAANANMAELQENFERASGKASRAEHIRRVQDIRGDLRSTDEEVYTQASRLIKMALNDIIESISIDVHGERVAVTLVSDMGFAIGKLAGPLAFLDTVKDCKSSDYYAGRNGSKAIEAYLGRRTRLATQV